jgi:dynein heavy chain
MTLRPPVEVHVERLKGLDYDILDVKSSRWHHDYNHFKSGAKDL